MPHAVAPDPAGAGSLGDLEHAAVRAGGDACDHLARRRPEPLRPVAAYKLDVAADAAAGNQHRGATRLEAADHLTRALLPAGHERACEHRAIHAGHAPALDEQFIDAVTEGELHQAALGRLTDPALKRLDDRRAGPPGQMEARNRVSVTERIAAAAFGPTGAREHAKPERPQPIPFLDGGELDVRPREPPRLLVLGSIKLRAAQPVRPGELERVVDASPALLGRVDEEQPAQRPEGLPAERGLRLLVEQQHAFAGGDQLRRGDQASQATAHNDCFGLQRRGGHAAAGYRPCG